MANLLHFHFNFFVASYFVCHLFSLFWLLDLIFTFIFIFYLFTFLIFFSSVILWLIFLIFIFWLFLFLSSFFSLLFYSYSSSSNFNFFICSFNLCHLFFLYNFIPTLHHLHLHFFIAFDFSRRYLLANYYKNTSS